MDKKTKNIVTIIIILVLVVCLAFTIADKGENKTEVVNFNMPNITRRGNINRNSHFTLPQRDNKTDREDEEEKKEDTTLEDEAKEDNSCKCQETRGQMDNWNNQRVKLSVTNKGDNSMKTVLIVAESFLLGASVMFLILNNIEKEDNKTRRVK